MLLTVQRSMPAQLWPMIVQMSSVVRSCLCSANSACLCCASLGALYSWL